MSYNASNYLVLIRKIISYPIISITSALYFPHDKQILKSY